MVVFTCMHCGSSVKKNKVEKHYNTECRNFPALTCVDCVKDFKGDEYQTHTKCVTEQERYAATGFQPKPSQNKGEQKQQEWVQMVHNIVETQKNLSSAERKLLELLVNHENIPRKKSKFQNFIQNITKKSPDPVTTDRVWDLLETGLMALKLSREENKAKTNSNDIESKNKDTEETIAPEEEKLSKKERKEKKKREKYEAELRQAAQHVSTEENDNSREEKKKKKKKKSRKGAEESEEMAVENGTLDEEEGGKKKEKKKSKKRHLEEEGEHEEQQKPKKHKENGVSASQDQDPKLQLGGGKNGKFKWDKAIVSLLEAQPDQELSIKKLRKKAFALYEEAGGDPRDNGSVESALANFNKKVYRIPVVKIVNENAKLVM